MKSTALPGSWGLLKAPIMATLAIRPLASPTARALPKTSTSTLK
jgi:hypothetical protein